MNSHSCIPIWCAAICAVPIRAATPAATMNAAWNAAARTIRSRPSTSWARITPEIGVPPCGLTVQGTQEEPRRHHLGTDVRPRGADQSEPERVDEHG